MKEIQQLSHQFQVERPLMEKANTPHSAAARAKEEIDEMLAEMQWGEEAPTPEQVESVGLELADVILFTLSIANQLGIDVDAVVKRKIAHNEERFPKELFQDTSKDYYTVYLARKRELGERQ